MANKLVSLRKKKDFLLLKKKGVYLRKQDFFLLYRKNKLAYSRFAWAFYVRGKGKAILRNRLKRWAREFMREKSLHWEQGMDVLCGAVIKNFLSNNQKLRYEKIYLLFEALCQQIKH